MTFALRGLMVIDCLEQKEYFGALKWKKFRQK